MQKSLLLLLAALALAAGCGHRSHPDATAPLAVTGQMATLTETEVLAIARQAVTTNDTWLDRAEFEPPKRRPDGSWSVLVWLQPALYTFYDYENTRCHSTDNSAASPHISGGF